MITFETSVTLLPISSLCSDLAFVHAAIQPNIARTPGFDGQFALQTPEDSATGISLAGLPGLMLWLNVEYPTFYQQHPGKNSLASYLTTFLKQYKPQYLSATEVGILKLLVPTASRSATRLVLKFLSTDLIEESTNSTYGQILTNLTDIATFAGGILVPKEFIYPTVPLSNGSVSGYGYYSGNPTTLVQDAHNANLEVFVYGFANDIYPSSYNNSFDPVLESLNYVGDSFTVDGIVSDFPSTVAEAIFCYPDGYDNPSTIRAAPTPVRNPLIIAQNGASGDYPGSTLSAYVAAVKGGSDYIECSVQITKDGVPICRDGANLVNTTNVALNPDLFETKFTTYQEMGSGVFSFDLTLEEIRTLRAIIYSPFGVVNVSRDPSLDGKEGILTLDEFLSFAKNNSGVGVYVNVQNAYFVRTVKSLDMVSAVVTSLTTANLTNVGDKVYLASEDSSALAAFQSLIPSVQRVYVTPDTGDVTITTAVLQEIKKYADIVTLDRAFVDPFDSQTSFLLEKTSVVSAAKSLNMTVFYHFLANEFSGLAFDYRADPILKISYLISEYNLDGFITDHPATLYNFLYNNYCWNLLGGQKTVNYAANLSPLFPVSPVPGAPAVAPSPALSVAEPPVSYLVPAGSPLPNSSIAPAPSSNPSSATKLPLNLLTSIVLIFILTLLLN
uniref:glycerophosphodiester phosphodiesterase n=1 Tax=Physcomitrium patens TaxID=3218 RepID=A0A7I4D1P1_PHYPA